MLMFPIFPASKVLYMPDIYLEHVSDFVPLWPLIMYAVLVLKSMMAADNFFPFSFSLENLNF